LAGFCAVSLAADKVVANPEAAQLAGYCGAFLGALVGRGRRRERAIFGTSNGKPASEISAAVPAGNGSEHLEKN
jgi:hypothetical protein